MFNPLETPLVELNQYTEYLNLNKFYINYKSTSIPVRYYNIDIANSNYDETTLTTFDAFKNQVNGLVYNVYEFTPAFYTSPIISMTTMEQDKDFSRFNMISNIQIYTIEQPYIGDLVQFYTPNDDINLFRVVNFRVPIVNHLDLPIYELDLEPAPVDIINTEDNILASIKINNRYAYDYSNEKYIPIEQLKIKETIYTILNTQYKQFLSTHIDSNELLWIDYNDEQYILIELNYTIYKTISNFNKKFRNTYIPIPFGAMNYQTTIYTYEQLNSETVTFTTINNEQITITPPNIILDDIDITTFNIDDYTDYEKLIILLYFIEKLKE